MHGINGTSNIDVTRFQRVALAQYTGDPKCRQIAHKALPFPRGEGEGNESPARTSAICRNENQRASPLSLGGKKVRCEAQLVCWNGARTERMSPGRRNDSALCENERPADEPAIPIQALSRSQVDHI